MNYEEIIDRFPRGKARGKGYQCKCPNHDDKRDSLSISKSTGGKTLIYCHAGCDTRNVLAKVGLKVEDLYEGNIKQKVNKKTNFFTEKSLKGYLLNLNIKGKGKIVEIYKYTDENGNFLYYKLRTDPKGFMFVRCIDGKLIWEMGAGRYYETYEGSNQYSINKKNTKSIELEATDKGLYNLPVIEYAKAEGYPIFIVEGEKDVETMKKIGLIAISSPIGGGQGDKKWIDEYSQLLKGCDVIILPDNDRAGLEHAKSIKVSLLNYCYKVREYIISDKKKGDVTNWYESLEGKDKEEARNILLDKVKLLEPSAPKWFTVTPKIKVVSGITTITGYEYKLRKNYLANHLRSTLNFIMIGDIVTSKPTLYVYHQGVYELRLGLSAEIAEYFPVDNIYPHLLSEIETLMFTGARIEIKTSECFAGEDNIINFKNGLYNVITKVLSKHTPRYTTSIQLQCNYNPKAKNHGYWDKFIHDLSEEKEDHKIILQEMAGVVISNIPGYRVKKFLGLYGKGDSGKGKFWEVLHEVIGHKAVGVVSIQELCGENGKFNTVGLFGKTFVYDGDSSKVVIKDPTKLKKITGGDNLKGEFKGKDIFYFKFMGVYATTFNELPIIEGDVAEHMFKRVQMLPCNNVIPVERQEKYLIEDILKYDTEYIITWALEGLQRFIKNNYEFSYCEDIEITRKKYKLMSDSVFAFIEDMYEITGEVKSDRVPLSEIRRNYLYYCKHEGIDGPIEKKREFINRCENISGLKFGKVGVECIKGLKPKK